MLSWMQKCFFEWLLSEPIKENKISPLAVAEVACAIGVYWSIAIYFQTHLHILISVIVVPMLLLRSDESCSTAARWWGDMNTVIDKLERKEIEDMLLPSKVLFWLLLFLTIVITYLVCEPIAAAWLRNVEGLRDVRILGIGMISIWVSAVVANVGGGLIGAVIAAAKGIGGSPALVTAVGVSAGVISGPVSGVIAGTTAVGGVIWRTGAAEGTELILELVLAFCFVALVGMTWIIVLGAGVLKKISIVTVPALVIVFFMLAVLVRVASGLVNFRAGIRDWSANWQRTMVCEDIRQIPALVPGIGAPGVTLNAAVGWILTKPGLLVYCYAALIFFPAQLWRWSIKSTCWFYAPLYLLSSVGAEKDRQKRKHALAASPGFIGWVAMVYAVVVLLVAIINAVDWGAAFEQWESIGNAAPFSPLAWWFITDWSKFIERPWQWFHLPAAVLTLVCFFWLDQIGRRRKAAIQLSDSPDRYYSLSEHPGKTIYRLQRIKQWLVTAAMFTGIWYFSKWAYEFGALPSWIKPFLSTFFSS